jgi:hypothetical protein
MELLEYVKVHGHAKVPLNHATPQGFWLGRWVATARRKKLRNELSLERATKLDSVPGWSWKVLDEAWEEGLRTLEGYIANQGGSSIPRSHVTTSGFRLGAWVDRQRRLNADGRLDHDRARRLEAIPVWSWEREVGPDGNLEWEVAFGKLTEFASREGHAMVPRDYETLDGFQLGDWVRSQRKSQARVLPDRKKKLEELPGWKWTVRMPTETLWEKAFRELVDYAEREGHARVAKDFRLPDGFRLGPWVQTQRSEMERLPVDRRVRLEALPGWTWNALSDRWENGFRHLLEFVQREGHAVVKQGFVSEDGYRLASWVQNQRAWRERMSRERAARLEALPGWRWTAESLEWADWISLLEEFARQHGHARVPQLFKTSEGFLLGRWVNSRRSKRDRLSPEQQAELEELPGWVWRAT